MTRKRKCHTKSNSFVAATEQVCLQPVLDSDEADVTPLGSHSTPLLQQQERHDLRQLTDDRSERQAVQWRRGRGSLPLPLNPVLGVVPPSPVIYARANSGCR